jgi:nitrogen fixation protein NifU and related proteins
MDDPLYREIILEHWQNPQNYGTMKNPDFKVEGNNPTCGDIITITGIIKNDKLTDIKFTSDGCAISKASASLFTEKIKGLKLKEIKKLDQEDALEELGVTITPARHNCALLCFKTIQKI